jgi:hypothetical protein
MEKQDDKNNERGSKYAVTRLEADNNHFRTPKSKQFVKTVTSNNSTTQSYEIFEEDIALQAIDRRVKFETKYDKRFGNEDRAVVFSFATFLEEGLVQTSFAFFGPLCWLWAIQLCTINGLKITGFYPGELIQGNSYLLFGTQTIFSYCLQAPLLFFLYLYMTNQLSVYPESSILPTTYILIPILVIVVRQFVIAVKYSFIPRRRMREERVTTRREDEMNDDLLGTWMGKPRNESLAFQLDLALWRSDLNGEANEEYITFVTPIPGELIDELNLPEITMQKEGKGGEKEKKKRKVDDGKNYSNSKKLENDGCDDTTTTTTTIDIDNASISKSNKQNKDGNDNTTNTLKRSDTVSTNRIPLRILVKYAAFKGTLDVSAPFGYVLFGLLVFISAPLTYLALNGKPLFGIPGNSFEQYVCAVGWINCVMVLAPNLLLFPSAPDVIFKRSRFRLHRFFELLIPSSVLDVSIYIPLQYKYTRNVINTNHI